MYITIEADNEPEKVANGINTKAVVHFYEGEIPDIEKLREVIEEACAQLGPLKKFD